VSELILESLITSGSGLLGAFLGAAGSYFQATRLRERDKQDEAARRDQDRQDEQARQRRSREEAAGDRIDLVFSQLRRELPDKLADRFPDGEVKERTNRVYRAFDEIEAQAAYLPEDVRKRVLEYRAFLYDADELSADRYGAHYDHWPTIVVKSCRESHEVLAAFLRHGKMPVPSPWLADTRRALDHLYEIRAEEYYPDIAAACCQ
jgi:hypothetical protein